jgi:hypothetical protein
MFFRFRPDTCATLSKPPASPWPEGADHEENVPPRARSIRACGRHDWQAEATKMIKVYGAPIEDADVPKLVEYLSTAY